MTRVELTVDANPVFTSMTRMIPINARTNMSIEMSRRVHCLLVITAILLKDYIRHLPSAYSFVEAYSVIQAQLINIKSL